MDTEKDNNPKLHAFKKFVEHERSVCVAVASDEDYTTVGYGKDLEDAEKFTDNPKRWIVQSYKPYFITYNDNEDIKMYVEADSMEELVKKINSLEDWYAAGSEEPMIFTKETLIDNLNKTEYDRGSSAGWILFAHGKPITKPISGRIIPFPKEDF
jgi:hypothetical protein